MNYFIGVFGFCRSCACYMLTVKVELGDCLVQSSIYTDRHVTPLPIMFLIYIYEMENK